MTFPSTPTAIGYVFDSDHPSFLGHVDSSNRNNRTLVGETLTFDALPFPYQFFVSAFLVTSDVVGTSSTGSPSTACPAERSLPADNHKAGQLGRLGSQQVSGTTTMEANGGHGIATPMQSSMTSPADGGITTSEPFDFGVFRRPEFVFGLMLWLSILTSIVLVVLLILICLSIQRRRSGSADLSTAAISSSMSRQLNDLRSDTFERTHSEQNGKSRHEAACSVPSARYVYNQEQGRDSHLTRDDPRIYYTPRPPPFAPESHGHVIRCGDSEVVYTSSNPSAPISAAELAWMSVNPDGRDRRSSLRCQPYGVSSFVDGPRRSNLR